MTDEVLYRSVKLERLASSDKKTVNASLSSETVVDRYFGGERLLHTRDAVDLSRAKDGIPLLFNHNPDEPIGKVKNVRLENGRLRGELFFGNSRRAKEIRDDVTDDLIDGISIGYRINKMERADGDDDVYNAVDWTLLEASIAPIPADQHVGIGRTLFNNTLTLRGKNKMDEQEHTSRSARRRENSGVADERERANIIMAIGEKHNCISLARDYVASGKSENEFRSAVLSRFGNPKPIEAEAPVMEIGMSRNEIEDFSFVRAINALINKDWSGAGLERECTQEMARITGRNPEGFLVPTDVLTHHKRDLNIGTATAGGNLVPTDYMDGSFVDILRNKTQVIGLGATVLPGLSGNVAIPRKTGASTAYWVAEGAAPTESQQAFDQITMAPNTVGGYVDYTRKMLLQASPAIEMLVRGDLASTIAIETDRVAINGSGTGSEPTGILNTAGIGSVAIGTDGGNLGWSHIVDLEGEVAVDNADDGSLAYLTNSSVRKSLKQTEKVSGTGLFIWESGNEPGVGRLNGYRSAVSNNVPADLTKGTGTDLSALIYGNFRDLLIGQWSTIDITVDPYSFSNTGTVRIVALQDIDLAVRHAESFAAIVDATT